MAGANTSGKEWPRIHLVYFFLAACDLMAVMGGLYLSHRQVEIFQASVESDRYWDAHLDEVWSLSRLIQAANSPPNDVFDTHDPIGESKKFELAITAVNAKVATIKANLRASLSAKEQGPPLAALSEVEAGMQSVGNEARAVFQKYSQGDTQGAGISMARTDRINAETNRRVQKSVDAIRAIKDRLHRQHFEEASWLKSFEYVIVCFILAMVAIAAYYGHSVSRLMTSKYRELQSALGDLAESEAQANRAAKTDPLSGLQNRHGFIAYTRNDALSEAAAKGQAGVIFIDLNGFKEINDAFGHLMGDKVIERVAERIESLMPSYANISRIGGDEFAVIMTGENAEMGTPIYADLIVRSFSHPIDVDNMKYHASASVGYSVSMPHKLLTVEELIHNADVAMYDAKVRNEERAIFYHVGLELEAQHRREIEVELRAALAKGELHVEYQPVISSTTGKMVSAEALVRWNSPKRGMVSPIDFIPVAEGCGLVHDIGTFVLRSVCEDLPKLGDIDVSVNVSAVQLKHPGFVDEYTRIVRSYGVNPARIEIELTETMLVENPAAAAKRLNALKEAGFSISLDDYGMGFSSLGVLKQLPFDKLKVDRSFVAAIGQSEHDDQLLESLSLLSRSLHLKVVAEGVETEDQAKQLKLLNYDLLQGWHTGRPMPIDKISALATFRRRAKAA